MTREPWLGFRAPKLVETLPPPADEPPDGLPVVYWRPLRCPRCHNRTPTLTPVTSTNGTGRGHGRKSGHMARLKITGTRSTFRYQLCLDCGLRFKSMEIDEGT